MSIEDLAKATDPFRNAVRGLLRRVSISRAAAVLWQFAGVNKSDAASVEVFYGVGVCALPARSGKPEAILVNVGGASAPVIIATRDEKTRAAVVPSDLKAGETVIYSEGVIVYLKKDSVEIRTPEGEAKQLAFRDELAALRTYVLAHTHGAPGGTTTAPSFPTTPPSAPTGTTILKGE